MRNSIYKGAVLLVVAAFTAAGLAGELTFGTTVGGMEADEIVGGDCTFIKSPTCGTKGTEKCDAYVGLEDTTKDTGVKGDITETITHSCGTGCGTIHNGSTGCGKSS